MKKKNPNDEVNVKILQVLDDSENNIAASNKELMNMTDDYVDDILEDIDELNHYKN